MIKPVERELTVITADVPKDRTIGFAIFETTGVGYHNPQALQRLKINRGKSILEEQPVQVSIPEPADDIYERITFEILKRR